MAHTITTHYRNGHVDTTRLGNPRDFHGVDADARADHRHGGVDWIEIIIDRGARRLLAALAGHRPDHAAVVARDLGWTVHDTTTVTQH